VPALTRLNVFRVLQAARDLHRQAQTRVSTADVNKAVRAAYALRRPRAVSGKIGKIFYGTQVDVSPPSFVLFVDDPSMFEDAYKRFIENRFREMLLRMMPLKINFRPASGRRRRTAGPEAGGGRGPLCAVPGPNRPHDVDHAPGPRPRRPRPRAAARLVREG
jgi:predicted GTPase